MSGERIGNRELTYVPLLPMYPIFSVNSSLLAWIKVLVGFMFAQVGVILLQNWLGPVFFLPRSVS
jgi:hypothetical protein